LKSLLLASEVQNSQGCPVKKILGLAATNGFSIFLHVHCALRV